MTILLDGAMGTELERRGARMDAPLWSAHALIDGPALVRTIHREYLEAGAQVITTNTFRTHARSLAEGGLEADAGRLTRLAVSLAREAREEAAAGDPAIAAAAIAGSMSPLEDCFAPERSPVRSRALPEHVAIAGDLAEGGADLLLIETMGRIDECCAAIEAAATTGLPCWLSVVGRVVDGEARLLGGERFAALVAAVAGLPIQALLLNCTQLADLPVVLPAYLDATANTDLARGLYPHTGHSDPVRGWQTHTIDAEGIAARLAGICEEHPEIDLVGSCCGSTPTWTAALARRLHGDPQGRRRGFAELRQLLDRGAAAAS
ncbi:MAG: homocysteine S-methyltransferase family protein [Myxococcales bacterium]|nr:homocysteine S-methyltransferase family protein [Myxococcales bacterium]